VTPVGSGSPAYLERALEIATFDKQRHISPIRSYGECGDLLARIRKETKPAVQRWLGVPDGGSRCLGNKHPGTDDKHLPHILTVHLLKSMIAK
jgi:hypothetical protein